MSEDTTVHAQLRDQFGKGFARRLRAAGQIPAVIYGHGTQPQHVALPGHQISLLVRRANAVLELDVDGHEQLALVKDIQRDPVRQVIEHIDLLVVKKGEKIHVEVPLVVIGEPAAGTVTNLDLLAVALQVEATNIPEHVQIDVTGMEDGARLTAGDLKLPAGAVLVSEPDTLALTVTTPVAEAEEPAAETEGAPVAEAPAAE